MNARKILNDNYTKRELITMVLMLELQLKLKEEEE